MPEEKDIASQSAPPTTSLPVTPAAGGLVVSHSSKVHKTAHIVLSVIIVILIGLIVWANFSKFQKYAGLSKNKTGTQLANNDNNSQHVPTETPDTSPPAAGVTLPPQPQQDYPANSPKVLLYDPDGQGVEIFDKGLFHSAVRYSDQWVKGVSLSPDGKRFVYGRTKNSEEAGVVSLYGSPADVVGMAYVDAPHNQRDIITDSTTAKGDFNWSPDSSKISYVVNDGESIEIFDLKQNKVVFSSKGYNNSALIWVDSDTFSFIQGNKLYQGNLSNPKQTVLASNVHNALCGGEGPPNIVAPNWSPDHKYVGYYTDKTYQIRALADGKIISPNLTVIPQNPDQDLPCDDPNITPMGWDNSDNFYFTTFIAQSDDPTSAYQTVKVLTLSGDQKDFVNTNTPLVLSTISPDGSQFYYQQAQDSPATPATALASPGLSGSIMCKSNYNFGGPDAWSKKSTSIVALNNNPLDADALGSSIIFDISQCKALFQISLNTTDRPLYGLEVAGVQ